MPAARVHHAGSGIDGGIWQLSVQSARMQEHHLAEIGGDARLCLLQLFNARYMPPSAFCAAAAAVALAAIANAARLNNSLRDRSWAVWKEVLGLLGVVLLTQVPPPPPPPPKECASTLCILLLWADGMPHHFLRFFERWCGAQVGCGGSCWGLASRQTQVPALHGQ